MRYPYGLKLKFDTHSSNTTFYDDNNRQQIHMPAEVAIARHDDLISLLVAVGIPIDIGMKRSVGEYASSDERRSLIDWVRYAINCLSRQIAKLGKCDPEPPTESNWNTFHAKHLRAVKNSQASQTVSFLRLHRSTAEEDGKSETETLHELESTKAYLTDVLAILTANHAKTWNDIYSDGSWHSTAKDSPVNAPSLVESKPSFVYAKLASHAYSQPISKHLASSYDELYAACFAGDNHKIQELCLPAKLPAKESLLLQITVQTAFAENTYDRTGLTPFVAAIQGRHWDTARLVLAIAGAQYHPKEKAEKFRTADINLGEWHISSPF